MHSPARDVQRLTLPPAPDSARRARALVREALAQWGLADLEHAAQLVVSELVTNAALHAGTDIDVEVRRLVDGVRVAVHDGAAEAVMPPVHLPAHTATPIDDAEDLDALEQLLTAAATTGRGLQLVASLAHDWGVEPAADGKAVWAVCRTDGAPTPTVEEPVPETALPVDGPTVRFVAMPVRLALESDLNLDALIREFQVMGAAGDALPHPAPLVQAAREILERYARPRAAGRRAARDAVARGDRLLDVELPAPEGAVPALRHLTDLLDVVDEHCRSGDLLALASSEELRRFRTWYVDEIERQLEGLPPRPCPFPVAPQPVGPLPDTGPPLPRTADEATGRLAAALAEVTDVAGAARVLLAEVVDVLGATHA